MPNSLLNLDASPECSLNSLTAGSRAGILCIECGQDVSLRLQELGFVPGANVEVLSTGCPLVVRVGDTRLCIREAQASVIKVQPF